MKFPIIQASYLNFASQLKKWLLHLVAWPNLCSRVNLIERLSVYPIPSFRKVSYSCILERSVSTSEANVKFPADRDFEHLSIHCRAFVIFSFSLFLMDCFTKFSSGGYFALCNIFSLPTSDFTIFSHIWNISSVISNFLNQNLPSLYSQNPTLDWYL